MSAHLDVKSVIDGVADRRLPATANAVSLAMIAIGVVAFPTGLFGIGDGGAVAWGAYLVGLVYTLALAQGGVMFSVLQSGTWGRWGRPLKRIGETFGFFLPVAYAALVVFLLFGLKIYVWNPSTIIEGGVVDLHPHSTEVYAAKPFWLSPWVFRIRLLLAVGLLMTLDFVYLRASFTPDLILAKARLGAKAPAWWDRIIGGRTDAHAAMIAGQNQQSVLMPILAWAYALIMSLVAFDLVMSLSPTWASNIFGAWVTVTGFSLTLAALGVTGMIAKDWLGISGFLTSKVTLDLGKLLMVGTMFWAYTSMAQLMPIWYTDMPVETNFLLIRMYLPEWTWLAQTVGILCFVAPFTILLSRGIKKMRWPFLGVCALFMCGVFLERTMLVMPSIYFHDPRDFLVIFTSVGTWLGFLGAFIQVVGRALASVPPLVVTDPNLETHPWDVHVHALDHGHGGHGGH